jgi:hypothetical protein
LTPDVIARFWAKVNRQGPIPAHRPKLGRCWVYTGSLVKGYGQVVLARLGDGTQPHVYAHRLAYELEHGPLPSADVKVCHHCDNPPCVRDAHLFAGSQDDNLKDAARKGHFHRPRTRKLSLADRLTIYWSTTPSVDLARRYGVTKTCISLTKKGRFVGAPVLERVPSRQLEIRGEVA